MMSIIPKKVLITYGLRPFAQRVAKILPAEWEVLYASSEEIPAILLNKQQYIRIPAHTSPSYAHEMLSLSLDLGVDYLLPLGLGEFSLLAETELLFDEYNISILVPDKEVLPNLKIAENPTKDVSLQLICRGVDLLSGEGLQYNTVFSGVMAMDSGGDPIICCVKD